MANHLIQIILKSHLKDLIALPLKDKPQKILNQDKETVLYIMERTKSHLILHNPLSKSNKNVSSISDGKMKNVRNCVNIALSNILIKDFKRIWRG